MLNSNRVRCGAEVMSDMVIATSLRCTCPLHTASAGRDTVVDVDRWCHHSLLHTCDGNREDLHPTRDHNRVHSTGLNAMRAADGSCITAFLKRYVRRKDRMRQATRTKHEMGHKGRC